MLNRNPNPIFHTALKFQQAGLSVIPILPDGSKAPAISAWKRYQNSLPTEAEISDWFNNGLKGIGIVCGRVSGGVEVIDFDAPGVFDLWIELVKSSVPEILNDYPTIRTPKGFGRHVYLKRRNPANSSKLALRKTETGKVKTLIEIRGEGAYVLAPGCPPQCNDTGIVYEHLLGPSLEEWPSISYLDDSTYQILISSAKALNEYVEAVRVAEVPMNLHGDGSRPGDEYSRTVSWDTILTNHNWKQVRVRENTIYWQRPGKEGKGISATTGYCSNANSGDLLFVFSTNAHPFENDRAYSKYAAYALLNHEGNFNEAAKALVDQGYGQRLNKDSNLSPTPPKPFSPPIPWKPFPIHAIPEPIQSFIIEGSKALVCDPAYVALPSLSALASAIGNTRRIQLKRSWKAPSIVWTVVVAGSGTLKSPALDLALTSLRKEDDLLIHDYQESLKDHKARIILHKERLNAWKHRQDNEPPQEPEEPTLTRYIVSDTTIEALALILRDNPRGVLLGRDELSGWFGGFGAFKSNKGPDVAQYLELHRAGRLIVDRKTGPSKTIYVPRASVSITGTIQPGTLKRVLTPEFIDNGLAARLLLAMPPRKPKIWSEATVSPELQEAVDHVFRTLLQLDFHSFGFTLEPVDIPLSPEAASLWIDYYNDIAHKQLWADNQMAAALSKLEEYAARFALVFRMVQWSQEGGDPDEEIFIEKANMAAGIFLARWFAGETERIYGILSESNEDRNHRELIDYIRNCGGVTTVRTLTHGPKKYRGEGGTQRAERALHSLVEANVLRKRTQKPDGPGRPVEVFELLNFETLSAVPISPTVIVAQAHGKKISNDTTGSEPSTEEGCGVIVAHGDLQKPPFQEETAESEPTQIHPKNNDDWGDFSGQF